MAVIKQKNGIKLIKLKNDRKDLSNKRFKYLIEFPDGDRIGEWYTKENAMRQFRKNVDLRSSSGSGGSGGMLGGLF